MANGTVAIKEAQEKPIWASIHIDTRRQITTTTHYEVALKIDSAMRLMYWDLEGVSALPSAKMAGKGKYGEDFREEHYEGFTKLWNSYNAAYYDVLYSPSNKGLAERYYGKLRDLINSYSMAVDDYIEKKTELWFRYSDVAMKPVDAAFYAGLAISVVSGGTSLIEAAPAGVLKVVMEKAVPSMVRPAVRAAYKKVMKKALMADVKAVLNKTMAPIGAIYLANAVGQPMAKDIITRPEMAKSTISLSDFASRLMEDKEFADAVKETLLRNGVPDTYVSILESQIAEATKPNPQYSVYMLNAALIAALYALPFLPKGTRKVKSLFRESRTKGIEPSTVPTLAPGQ
jgi:hypothetical protein